MAKKIITFLISCSLLSALSFPGPAWAGEGSLLVDNLTVTEDATVYGKLSAGFSDITNGLMANGGTITTIITTNGSYRIHTFTSDGTFQVLAGSGNVEVLVVAGGGGGGSLGGGGGAGGLIYTSIVTDVASYAVVIGEGGAGGYGEINGSKGDNTTFSNIVAYGGGYGVGNNTDGGGSGGSGGGGGRGGAGGAATNGQGYAGGTGPAGGYYPRGGGGGAGAVGFDGMSSNSGNGGIGISNNISGSFVYYAGGGGAGADSTQPVIMNPGIGGLGGGGSGTTNNATASPGIANTGGGGGGGGYDGSFGMGGSGGSGIVIVRYTMPSSSNIITSLTISSNGISQVSGSATNVFMGKVGVGTDIPAEKLHVGGNVQVDGTNIVGAMTLGGETRTNWPSGAEGALMVSNNLSEITGEANKDAARSNLGLGSAATNEASVFLSPTSDGSQLTNITAAQVGAVSTNAGALIAANNLYDLVNASVARTNLGLGSAAINDANAFLSTTGGVVNGEVNINGSVSVDAPAGDVPMGVYTNQ